MKQLTQWAILALLPFALLACNTFQNDQDQADQAPTHAPRQSDLDTLVAQIATPTQIPGEILDQLAAEDQVLINLYQRVNPSVVSIEIASRTSSLTGEISSGSGFIYDTDGHIITNAHVVQDAFEILVSFHDGYITTAELIGVDEYSDLALLQINVAPERLIPVEMGDSSTILVGQRVVAIGNPFGLQSSMTTGIVSAVGRALPSSILISQSNSRFNNPSIIQVDAAVNPGNSGGPLLNYEGQVIGVNTAIRSESGSFEGVAFAVPVNTVKRIVPQLISTGKAEYAWLGISTYPDDPFFSIPSLVEILNLPVDHGIIVEEVIADSPAEVAGIQGGSEDQEVRGENLKTGGDIIVAINGVFVRDLHHLLGYLAENTTPGDVVTLTIIRENQTLDIEVELGIRP